MNSSFLIGTKNSKNQKKTSFLSYFFFVPETNASSQKEFLAMEVEFNVEMNKK